MEKVMLSKKVSESEGADWDVDEITQQIWQDCQDKITQGQVREAVDAVAAKFQNARVKTYIPIFIRREARKLLVVNKQLK